MKKIITASILINVSSMKMISGLTNLCATLSLEIIKKNKTARKLNI
jgi:hypothetical protein